MRVFADTNFLARLYLDRPETHLAEETLRQGRELGIEPLPITWLLRIEVVVALEQYVFIARTRGGRRVSSEHARMAQIGFAEDVERGDFLANANVPLDALTKETETMALRQTAKHGFRVYDLMHVTSALMLRCQAFWSFDERARKLATLEGLQVNPL